MTEGDHEHTNFEKYAASEGLDNTQHPLHLLYLDAETSSALDAFKAGYLAGKSKLDESQTEPCQHNWISANNEKITGAEICTKCLNMQAA